MARFFSEQEIDGFRDCFYLNCKSGIISDVDQLNFVMRSVGFSPTKSELKKYFEQRNNTIKFADFLDCAHAHTQVEKVPDEILKAFRVYPFTTKDERIKTDTLKHILCNWGEKLTNREFNALLKEMNIKESDVNYKYLVDSVKIPRSDN